MIAFALLVLVIAYLSVWYVGAYMPLQDTRLRNTLPKELTHGWRMQTEDGLVALAPVSRTEAGCLTGTLKLVYTLPVSLAGNMSICFQTKNESVRVWVADRLVYAYGELPQRAYGHGVGAVWNMAALPKNAAGKLLTVELTPIGGRTGLAPYRFLLDSHDGLIIALLRESASQLCASLVLALIGVGGLLLALLQKIRRGDRAGATFHFSMFVLLAAIWMATDSGLLQFVLPNKGVSYMLFGCSFYLLCTPLSLFLADTIPEKRRLFRVFSAVNSAYALLRIALYASGALDFETALWLLHLMMAGLILYTNWALLAPGVRTRQFNQPEMCWAMSAFTLLEGGALVSFYLRNKLDMLRNGYSSGFYYGILLFVLIVALGVIKKTQRIRRQAFKAEFFEQRAYADDLTGLLNAKGFDDKCATILRDAPDALCYAIVDFDVNFFSQFNANNGLGAGDALLKKIAETLRNACREDELCARQEADHFVCAVHGATFHDILERVRAADRVVRDRLSERKLLMSYGIVEVRDRALRPATLRNQALMAKRTVKGNYEQNIAIYDSRLHEAQLREIELLSGFEAALDNDEYVIFLQPKIDAGTERLHGAEALVRHIEPDGTVMSAGAIIETLESRGFVAKLDFYILEQVCKFHRRCREEGRSAFPVSSNFSRVHLYNPDFPARVAAIVDRYEIPHALVEIELTETAFLVGTDTLQATVSGLHTYGFRVAIDDFGSGYSSLKMLKDVDVDVIKLDREFLANCTNSARAQAVIGHTLRLAQEMGITSVAEGVENAQQLLLLREFGCDVIQGYYYSRPLPLEAFITKYLL